MKKFFQGLADKIKSIFSSSRLQDAFKKTQFKSTKSSSHQSFLQKLAAIDKVPFEKYLPIVITGALAYSAAQLTNNYIRIYTIPEKINVSAIHKGGKSFGTQRLRSEYDLIAKRNIFNSDGVIPPPISGQGDGSPGDIDGPAVASNLPLKLLGTIVHVNPAKSVATIEVNKGAKKVIPYIPNDEIENLAKLLKVERKRVVFRNKKNRRLEYIEMPEDLKFSFKIGKNMSAPTSSGNEEIAQVGNNYTIKREFLDKHISNIGEVLQQARAVPNRDPVTGEINGFRMLYVKPDSVFSKLGIKPGDLFKGVNGQNVTSIQQAMEMYNSLKSASSISILVEREGRSVEQTYNIE